MPASVVLRANRKLLYASLMTDASNAALEYDRRASEIEAFAIRNLELGTATQQDVAQAKSARLDAMLKGLLIDNELFVPTSCDDPCCAPRGRNRVFGNGKSVRRPRLPLTLFGLKMKSVDLHEWLDAIRDTVASHRQMVDASIAQADGYRTARSPREGH